MNDSTWQQARLIPTSGINGAQEQERRATSALLAVLGAVKEFGRELTKSLGAPAGEVQTFIEVEFDLNGTKAIPDGLLRVTRGGKVWTALVEVKTGRNELTTEQLERYLDVARNNGFQALLTISNQTPVAAGVHPTKVDKRKLRQVSLHHRTWSEILAQAVLEKEHRGIRDPDQAWILGELIRYLEHDRSGAMEFEDMSQSWVTVRNAVSDGTLRATDSAATEVAGRFDALLRFAALKLGTRLGTQVAVVQSRREQADPASRLQSHVDAMVGEGRLHGSLRIPDTVGPLDIVVDLRARQVTCSVTIDAPRDGRPTTKVNWLIRQLKHTHDKVRLEATVANQRGAGASELLGRVREEPSALILNSTKTLRTFTVATNHPMGVKGGRGSGSFIDGFLAAVDSFYGEILQSLKAWSAKPPAMRNPPEVTDLAKNQGVKEALISTAQSSQDGPEAARPDVSQNGQAPSTDADASAVRATRGSSAINLDRGPSSTAGAAQT